ncbi:hypothetical protein PBT90_08085 [Algoriphagus halophytocola]|uniref:Uncharacterized protein n=1 Tax=Algoriphagus halophytocola TaxID=2991499 RepID=A0ABY6MIP3_9BACT|nr:MULTISPECIES: hypothetical protein [unclassified Algoriphagus]UZD23344.1 hypothetical protein OM944_02395 [Algoriphagus sp. TR-M5]WBL44639.1 hypothetical protein PBT90_08085 [Algoriphagus sp. TR-M9]
MSSKQDSSCHSSWEGGFEQSNPAFSYPNPDLSSLPMLGNLDHINLLQRQLGVEWPEFSWLTEKSAADPNNPSKHNRCFQMFSPYISRLGYTDKGRVYSIICPQQGVFIPGFGTLNVEVTVTGQRGWANEDSKELAADLTVSPKIWFSEDSHDNKLVKHLWSLFEDLAIFVPFPFSKANAIQLHTYEAGNAQQPIFPLRKGETDKFESPGFARHPEAWTVANLQVEIGQVKDSGNKFVNEFNELVMKLFNMASGNMLQAGNILTWNVWFTHPGAVDRKEWAEHAERWRESIDVNHQAPTSPGTVPRYFDYTPFSAEKNLIKEGIHELVHFITDHFFKNHPSSSK